jgi:Endonuclease I
MSSESQSSSSSSGFNGGTYYSSIDWSQRGATLKTALSNLIFPHTDIGYGGLYNAYKTTDVRPNGKIWDMYSSIEYTPGIDENHGNYSKEGDNYNREHTIPQSVFNSATPMYSDLFHIYPTDSKVNGVRSNYPHGEITGSPSYTSSNGCKLGTSDPSTGYNGKVFEVIDEYKGDFARTYFYFVTAYQTKMTSFSFPSLASNTFPSLSTWAQELYLKWSKEDPVSEKEIKRNESVYSIQHNRNPFIDNPEAAEKIWGNLS